MPSIMSSIAHKLSNPTPFFGIKLWILILIPTSLIIIAFALFLTLCINCSRPKKPRSNAPTRPRASPSMNRRLLSREWPVQVELGGVGCGSRTSGGFVGDVESGGCWGPRQRYSVEELEAATGGFACGNVISCGQNSVVYRGVLLDRTPVVIKRLLSFRDKVEDFIKLVEGVRCIRHRNLVKLVGFCAEGIYRVLVYEYVDNGTLKHWLHECAGHVSPLSWSIRMNIILGVAKGLAFLHEDTEPLVVHQNLSSSKILLDRRWNPKIADFGITRAQGSVWRNQSNVLSPQSACPENLDTKSDVYSFGLLIMEIISGKAITFNNAFETEEYLIDWIKMMEYKKIDELVDPMLPEAPSPVELKRIILIALRCVDPDANDRPKMGEVLHMLEPRDLLLSDERVIKKQTSRRSSVKEEDIFQAAASLRKI